MVQASGAHTYKVLLIGSGMMTPPLVDYLTKFGDTHITVASNIVEDARKICQRHPQHMGPLNLDVFDVSNIASYLLKLKFLSHFSRVFSLSLSRMLSVACPSSSPSSHPGCT